MHHLIYLSVSHGGEVLLLAPFCRYEAQGGNVHLPKNTQLRRSEVRIRMGCRAFGLSAASQTGRTLLYVGCSQQCAAKCLNMGEKSLAYSVYWLPWYKYTHHAQFQATKVMSVTEHRAGKRC